MRTVKTEKYILEKGDMVYKKLSFTSHPLSGKVGKLISIEPCIVQYDDDTYGTFNINELRCMDEDK